MWGIIATWRMAHDGIVAAKEMLSKNATAADALETTIKTVEDYPFYKSVGYGGQWLELLTLQIQFLLRVN